MREATSICRVCSGCCGLNVTIDDAERVVKVRGDHAHLMSKGYACIKGLRIPEAMNSQERLLHPMKRQPDGSFEAISLSRALDEIAGRLRAILKEDGGSAVATFSGTSHWLNTPLVQMVKDFLCAIGSPNRFTNATIDQSSHLVTMGRMGYWSAGRQRFEGSDVTLLVGTNPLVSLGAYQVLACDPTKRLKAAKAQGLKLIVIDPRRSETAIHADCFLQPVPGEDATIIAGLIRLILTNGWEDAEFCARFVAGVAQMRRAVEPFTPDYVARRAGIEPTLLEQAAALFARDASRGIAVIGTGGTMAPHSNLTDHLVETLNALCGRYLREGERVPNPGVLGAPRPFRAEVVPPDRNWERGPKLNSGYGQLFGEFPSTMLADELLHTGKGRIRALFVNGGNPAVCLPNQLKAVAGLRALDLLVAIEPYMGATAKLCDYVLPPKLPFEREDVMIGPEVEQFLSETPFGQYLPALVAPPAGSEVIDDWYLYWALAVRLRMPLVFAGKRLQMDSPPTTAELLDVLLVNSRVPLSELRRHSRGLLCEEDVRVLPPSEGATTRFAIAPADVVAELEEVVADVSWQATTDFPHRLTVRRERPIMNSIQQNCLLPGERRHNGPAYVNPSDLSALGLSDGARVEIVSATGRLPAIVVADATLRRGVVAMSHCRGNLPEDDGTFEEAGASTSRLVATDRGLEKINAMPVMTAVPVKIVPKCVTAVTA